ncbi:MAG: C1 family peptidase, partial [Bacteroidales bacterium]|nr:C1 family peptidase [Bacteroidales bacterium]
MKKFLSGAILFIFFALSVSAQDKTKEKGGYQFTVVKELQVTPIKNQSRTSTCWSFSALSFLESELIRLGKGEHNLSEMFIVSNAYFDKADKYIRT